MRDEGARFVEKWTERDEDDWSHSRYWEFDEERSWWRESRPDEYAEACARAGFEEAIVDRADVLIYFHGQLIGEPEDACVGRSRSMFKLYVRPSFEVVGVRLFPAFPPGDS
jgi:hypothetical protein